MNKVAYDAIGIVEVSVYANAVVVLDCMAKAADIALLKSEKLLGGRLVTLIIGGTTSQVNAAIEAAWAANEELNNSPVKVAITISNPHPEILNFIF